MNTTYQGKHARTTKKKGTQKSNGRLYRYIRTKLIGDDISQNEIKLASNE